MNKENMKEGYLFTFEDKKLVYITSMVVANDGKIKRSEIYRQNGYLETDIGGVGYHTLCMYGTYTNCKSNFIYIPKNFISHFSIEKKGKTTSAEILAFLVEQASENEKFDINFVNSIARLFMREITPNIEELNINNWLCNKNKLTKESKNEARKNKKKEIRSFIKNNTNLPPISKMVSSICENVVGQDDAVKRSVLAVYSNLDLITKNLSISELTALKNNILMSGPSGVGKTEIARQISSHFNIPVIIEDMTQYTGAGWVGESIPDLLNKLYIKSEKNMDVAKRGIIVLDEIDKLAINENDSNSRHNTLEVQQGLLKLIEGSVIDIEMHDILKSKMPFDTKYLTVIASGAFNGYGKRGKENSSVKHLTKQDYINYGLMPEFVGRFKTFVTLNKLSLEDKVRILLESKLSVLNLRIADLESRGIKVNFESTKKTVMSSYSKRE